MLQPPSVFEQMNKLCDEREKLFRGKLRNIESTLERAKALYEEVLSSYFGFNFKRADQMQGILMVTVAAKQR